MNRTRIIICAFAMVLALGFGAYAAEFSDYLPADSLLYISHDLTGKTLSDYEQSQLFKMLEDPEFKKLFENNSHKQFEEMGLSKEEMRQLMRGRIAFAITEYEAPTKESGDPIPHLALFVDNSNPKTKLLMFKLKALALKKARENNTPIKTVVFQGVSITLLNFPSFDIKNCAMFSHKNTVVVASSMKAAKGIIQAMNKGTAKPLTTKPNFVAAKKKAANKSIMWGYFALDAFKKIVPIDKIIEDDPQDEMLAGLFGNKDIHTVAFSVISNSDQLAINIHLLGVKPTALLMNTASSNATKMQCLKALSKDFAGHFVLISVDVDKLWQELQKYDGSKSELNMVENIKEIEKAGKFSFKKDIIPNLTGDALIILSKKHVELEAMVLGIKNKSKLEQILLPTIKQNGEYKKYKYKGVTIHTTAGEATYAFTNDVMVMAESKKQVKSIIDSLVSKKPSLATTAEFKKANALICARASILMRLSMSVLLEMIGDIFFDDDCEDMDEDEDYEEWDEEDEDNLLVAKPAIDKPIVTKPSLQPKIEQLENAIRELTKLRERINAAGGDTAGIDMKIALFKQELAKIKSQGSTDTPKIPSIEKKDNDKGKASSPKDVKAIIKKYFKNIYAAIVPEKDCLTIKIILR